MHPKYPCAVSPSKCFTSPIQIVMSRRQAIQAVDRGRDMNATATQCITLQLTATHCNTLQLTANHCNTLQHTATHCNSLELTATHWNSLQLTATHCNSLQLTVTHCNSLPLTATQESRQCKLRSLNSLLQYHLQSAVFYITHTDNPVTQAGNTGGSWTPLQHTATHCNSLQRYATQRWAIQPIML